MLAEGVHELLFVHHSCPAIAIAISLFLIPYLVAGDVQKIFNIVVGQWLKRNARVLDTAGNHKATKTVVYAHQQSVVSRDQFWVVSEVPEADPDEAPAETTEAFPDV